MAMFCTDKEKATSNALQAPGARQNGGWEQFSVHWGIVGTFPQVGVIGIRIHSHTHYEFLRVKLKFKLQKSKRNPQVSGAFDTAQAHATGFFFVDHGCRCFCVSLPLPPRQWKTKFIFTNIFLQAASVLGCQS